MSVHKATVDELKPLIREYAGTRDGGEWAFQLSCRYCRDQGSVSVNQHAFSSEKELIKAAKKFVWQGWWFDEEAA